MHERSGSVHVHLLYKPKELLRRPINDRTRIDLGCFDATKKPKSFDIRTRLPLTTINSLIGVIEISCITVNPEYMYPDGSRSQKKIDT